MSELDSGLLKGLFKQAIESISECITITNGNNEIFFVNKAFINQYGYSWEEIIGKDISYVRHPVDKDKNPEIMEATLHGGWHGELLNVRKDGSVFPIHLSTSVIVAEDGTYLGMIGIATDITHKLETENALRESEKALKESNATKDKFFSIISHDLKSPFNAILGFSQILHESYDSYSDIEKKSFVKNIYESARNTSKLLVNLLEWAKMQLGKIDFIAEKLEVSALINDTIILLKTAAAAKNIRIITEVSYGMIVYSDENMIKTVLRNLISNAINYTDNGGQIRITSRRIMQEISGKPFIEISVIDNGVGLSPEKLNGIFQSGKSQNPENVVKAQTAGIGLMLCKEFVEKCGGTIMAESELGKGSTFSFALPA